MFTDIALPYILHTCR